MTILYAGGGTLGPVTPLLAVHARLKEHDPQIRGIWLGTPTGPERKLVEALGMAFVPVPVARWPRFLSWQQLAFPFRYWKALRVARRVLRQERPDVVVSAGGFTAVPVVRVAAKLGIPTLAHQLDWLPGLTNRFLADRATKITSSFVYQKPPFGSRIHVEPIATPVRFALSGLPARSQALRQLGLSIDAPTVFVMGGGTGAQALNELVQASWKTWRARGWQIIHLTGLGKEGEAIQDAGVVQKALCLPEEMRILYGAADVLVTRAGIGAISEAVHLRKPMILVPLPKSPQEANARVFAQAEAALVIPESTSDFGMWIEKGIQRLLRDAPFARLTVDRAAKVFETDQGEMLAERIMELAQSIDK